MLAKNKQEFISFFEKIDDYRQDEKVLYPLNEILFLVFTGVLGCAESWDAIIEYGKQKIEFLKRYFPYNNGFPSKSTLSTVIGMIDKKKFEQWFSSWTNELVDLIPEELIAIDGKTIRGSKTNSKKASHVLNAFATKQGLVLAQRTVGEKTNEIPEIPKLLDDLNIEGAVISIDAMGCQKEIAKKIIDKKANYFLALKSNHSTLESEAIDLFKQKENFNFYEEYDKGHGRVEIRKCWSIAAPDWFKQQGWEKLKSISMIESERWIKDKNAIEQRIYISSLEANPKQNLNYSRQHWLVENGVHWVLDVTFKEDDSQIKNAAENMSVIRKIIINLIKVYKEKIQSKSSLRTLRMMAGWSDNVAGGILGGLFV